MLANPTQENVHIPPHYYGVYCELSYGTQLKMTLRADDNQYLFWDESFYFSVYGDERAVPDMPIAQALETFADENVFFKVRAEDTVLRGMAEIGDGNVSIRNTLYMSYQAVTCNLYNNGDIVGVIKFELSFDLAESLQFPTHNHSTQVPQLSTPTPTSPQAFVHMESPITAPRPTHLRPALSFHSDPAMTVLQDQQHQQQYQQNQYQQQQPYQQQQQLPIPQPHLSATPGIPQFVAPGSNATATRFAFAGSGPVIPGTPAPVPPPLPPAERQGQTRSASVASIIQPQQQAISVAGGQGGHAGAGSYMGHTPAPVSQSRITSPTSLTSTMNEHFGGFAYGTQHSTTTTVGQATPAPQPPAPPLSVQPYASPNSPVVFSTPGTPLQQQLSQSTPPPPPVPGQSPVYPMNHSTPRPGTSMNGFVPPNGGGAMNVAPYGTAPPPPPPPPPPMQMQSMQIGGGGMYSLHTTMSSDMQMNGHANGTMAPPAPPMPPHMSSKLYSSTPAPPTMHNTMYSTTPIANHTSTQSTQFLITPPLPPSMQNAISTQQSASYNTQYMEPPRLNTSTMPPQSLVQYPPQYGDARSASAAPMHAQPSQSYATSPQIQQGRTVMMPPIPPVLQKQTYQSPPPTVVYVRRPPQSMHNGVTLVQDALGHRQRPQQQQSRRVLSHQAPAPGVQPVTRKPVLVNSTSNTVNTAREPGYVITGPFDVTQLKISPSLERIYRRMEEIHENNKISPPKLVAERKVVPKDKIYNSFSGPDYDDADEVLQGELDVTSELGQERLRAQLPGQREIEIKMMNEKKSREAQQRAMAKGGPKPPPRPF
ncbi:uncharacterized protein V1518DRAFT_422290 [Limtongia smithiae]|uniref:uncharacterized protein n=1 Tax=Limtongia smithiae TaxID=1125753 RepID=UPI0034CEBDB0